jgi:hypothetical protein
MQVITKTLHFHSVLSILFFMKRIISSNFAFKVQVYSIEFESAEEKRTHKKERSQQELT